MTEWVEHFLMQFDGGPYDGTKVTNASIIEWPLPDHISTEDGTYTKIRQSTLPPQTISSHVMRGAEYAWESHVQKSA